MVSFFLLLLENNMLEEMVKLKEIEQERHARKKRIVG
jgi:hypothetical protein